jgi:subtilisin family serine protease
LTATPALLVYGGKMNDPLRLSNLNALMECTEGDPEVAVALIDGPVDVHHPAFEATTIRVLAHDCGGCTPAGGAACRHGTLVAGVLKARRGSGALAICPGCTLLVRPIFAEPLPDAGSNLSAATPFVLAAAVLDCLRAGAWVINISAAVIQPAPDAEQALVEALDLAARRNVLVVVAAGNQGTIGGTALTRHPWVIPVAACNGRRMPLPRTNLGHSIGRHGLLAPGEQVAGLAAGGGIAHFGGTSAATPLVAGAAALLRSWFPLASGSDVRDALLHGNGIRRTSVIPPMLDAEGAYESLAVRKRRAA